MESDDSVSNLSITPGGSRYYLPKCLDNNCRPFVDQFFDSLVAGLSFYKEYGRVCGFDTRKSAEKKHDDGTTISKYVCLLYTSPSPRDQRGSRMPSSA